MFRFGFEIRAVLEISINRRRKIQRRPDFEVGAWFDSGEVFGIYADDGYWNCIQSDRRADHCWVASEPSGPILVADHRHRARLCPDVILSRDSPANDW